MFITDTSGKKSLTATLAIIGFAVVMLKTLASGASITVGSFSYSFGTIDGLTIGAIFGPILGSYTMRRWGQPTGDAADVDSGGKPGDGKE